MSGHILFAVFRLPFGCKIPPHTVNIINAKKIRFDGRTKTGKPCARSRLRRLRLPCALAPVRLFAVAVAVRVRPLHPPTPPPQNNPQKTTHTHTHPHPKSKPKNPPKTGAKNRPKTGDTNTQNPPPEKSRANFDTRVTHAHARTGVQAHTHAQLTRQSRA